MLNLLPRDNDIEKANQPMMLGDTVSKFIDKIDTIVALKKVDSIFSILDADKNKFLEDVSDMYPIFKIMGNKFLGNTHFAGDLILPKDDKPMGIAKENININIVDNGVLKFFEKLGVFGTQKFKADSNIFLDSATTAFNMMKAHKAMYEKVYPNDLYNDSLNKFLDYSSTSTDINKRLFASFEKVTDKDLGILDNFKHLNSAYKLYLNIVDNQKIIAKYSVLYLSTLPVDTLSIIFWLSTIFK